VLWWVSTDLVQRAPPRAEDPITLRARGGEVRRDPLACSGDSTLAGIRRRWVGRPTGMGADDKVENAAERMAGRGKEAVGAVTDNEELRDEGRGQQTEADVKDAGDKVKDAADKVGDAFKR
jgi:uncharacterized protein YjbJ (UPF0337 family)